MREHLSNWLRFERRNRRILWPLVGLIGLLPFVQQTFFNNKAEVTKQTTQEQQKGRLGSFPLMQAEQYLDAAKMFEQEGNYELAEFHYREYIQLARQLYPDVSFDGVLGRILDLRGRHDEANRYYANFESFATKQFQAEQSAKKSPNRAVNNEPGNSIGNLPRLVCDARLLRILQSIPYDVALREFPYAREILKQSRLPASELGLRVTVLASGPVVEDYRNGRAGGILVEEKQLRNYLSRLDATTAARNFAFAKSFHPRLSRSCAREEVSNVPVAGYTGIASPRDLMPVRAALLNKEDLARLKHMSSGARLTLMTGRPVATVRAHQSKPTQKVLLTAQSRRRLPDIARQPDRTLRIPSPTLPAPVQEFHPYRAAAENRPHPTKRGGVFRVLGKCVTLPLKIVGGVVSAGKSAVSGVTD